MRLLPIKNPYLILPPLIDCGRVLIVKLKLKLKAFAYIYLLLQLSLRLGGQGVCIQWVIRRGFGDHPTQIQHNKDSNEH